MKDLKSFNCITAANIVNVYQVAYLIDCDGNTENFVHFDSFCQIFSNKKIKFRKFSLLSLCQIDTASLSCAVAK